MKIGVCLKQVPAKDAPIRIADEGTWVREEDLSYEICEPDDYALEAALLLKEKHGGEVVVLTLGPARVSQMVKTALAKGADRAIHVDDAGYHKLDPFQVASTLAGAARDENFDLILTGLQSDDHGFGQTGVILAELLDRAHATVIMDIEVQDQSLRVKRELEGGWFQWVTLPLPSVLSIQSGINKPRYASLKGIMAAKKKKTDKVEPGSAADASQATTKVYVPEKQKQTEFIEGDAPQAAEALIQKLKNDARVL